MRTVLAATAAGALILGSAAGAMAAKPDTKPAPQTTVKLQSVSIKGHKTIDVGVLPAATVKLRATIWDPANKYTSTETVTLQLAAFTKKVKGDPVAAVTPFDAPALTPGKMTKKTDRFLGSVTLTQTTIDQLTTVITKDQPKVYLCISDATVAPQEVDKYSVQVQKRLGVKGPATDAAKLKKPVRDCIKVVDSSPDPA